jgi:hypothetical protein
VPALSRQSIQICTLTGLGRIGRLNAGCHANELWTRLLVCGLLQGWVVSAIVSVKCLGSLLPVLPAKSDFPRTIGAGVGRFVRGNFPRHGSLCHDLEYRPRVRVLTSVFLSDTGVIPDLAISPSMGLVAGNVNLVLVKQALGERAISSTMVCCDAGALTSEAAAEAMMAMY